MLLKDSLSQLPPIHLHKQVGASAWMKEFPTSVGVALGTPPYPAVHGHQYRCFFCGTVAEIQGDATTLLQCMAVFVVGILVGVQLQEEDGC